MPKLELAAIAATHSTGYPPPYDQAVQGRFVRRLAPAAGITDFGASYVVLKPGAWSSQRHWHEEEDELLVIISGQAILCDDAGRTVLHVGDIAAFPKNDGNGHCVINQSDEDCAFLVIGKATNMRAHYPDIDLLHEPAKGFVRKDGSEF
jgi:uncharacterized cupin superfamily protein